MLVYDNNYNFVINYIWLKEQAAVKKQLPAFFLYLLLRKNPKLRVLICSLCTNIGKRNCSGDGKSERLAQKQPENVYFNHSRRYNES